MRHTQERPMLRVTSSIGPSPLIAADNRRSNSGVGLLLADFVEKVVDDLWEQ
jgi:hypothetical protein